jgi:GPH family glycoside/pentoside/hexuronide:cation symporter
MQKIKRKHLPLYALSGFGPGLVNLMITAYLIDAMSTAGFLKNIENWTYANKTIVATALFSVFVLIAKVVDGIADVPLASLTDTLKTRWGKRRPAILIGYIPMIITFILFCFPLEILENSMKNTVWFGILLILFFTSYTLTLVTYYGTYSEVTENDSDRHYLSSWKAFYDTVQYSIGYAVIPLMVGGLNIRHIALLISPLLLTMVIPFFMLKEHSTLPKDVMERAKEEGMIEEEVSFLQSIKLTLTNKSFLMWLLVFSIFFFGLQMFLSGQNVLASGPMGLNYWQITIINTAAFAPVPLMLYFYRKIMKKKGFRFAFQTAMGSFAVAMLMFSVAYIEWIPNEYIRLAIAATGATIGSYGLGAFFSAPYAIPSQAAADELKATGKSHPSMYFAMQGLCTALVGALSTSIVWLNIKEITLPDNPVFGAHLMPYIVMIACVVAIIAANFMPKEYNEMGKEK